MAEIDMEKEVQSNPQDLTIRYVKKLIEQTNLFIAGQDAQTDIEKFCLFKTVSMNISFACELLLKTIIHNYNNGNDYTSWNTHNLLKVFDKLEQSDKDTISTKLNLSIQDIVQILQDKNTAEAYEKRYLYESGTGIPNYDFLCKLLNALLELNNTDITFDPNQITSLPLDYDTTQFDFEEIIKTHTQMLYAKAEVLEIDYTEDTRDVYVTKNINSCDLALFAELRFKCFDKDQRPKTEHEYSSLHKRLEEACKFLVTKSRYMDRYMSKDSTIDFVWALESLLFNETFNSGETVKDLYDDINETFKKSRYCTSEYYDNYYNALSFAETVKSITDLLLLNKDKATKILQTKQTLNDEYGYDFLQTFGFTVDEMAKIDLEYLKKLNNISSIQYMPKSILLENRPEVREKIFFYINDRTLRNKEIPSHIDYIVERTNDTFTVNQDKLNAYFKLKKQHTPISEERICKCIELSKHIKEDDIIVYIINRNYDITKSIEKYKKIVDKCLKITSNHREVSEFLKLHGRYLIDNEIDSTIYKMFVINKFFNSQTVYNEVLFNDFQKTRITVELSKYSFDEIIKKYTIFKSYNLESIFFYNISTAMGLNIQELKEKVKVIHKYKDFLPYYYYDQEQILGTDITQLVEFIRTIGVLNPENRIEIADFNSGEAEKLYKQLKEKNMLFIYETSVILSNFNDYELLDKVANKDIIKLHIHRYSKEAKQGIADLISIASVYPKLKDVLLDLLDIPLILEAPEILSTLKYAPNPLDKVYSLTIFNGWYERIINNNIKPGGNKENLSPDEIINIKQIFIESLLNSRSSFNQSELTKRLETIFSNNKLLHSIDKEILTEHDLSFMTIATKDCKLRYNEIDNFNIYANLFKTVKANDVSLNKMIELLNKLADSRRNQTVKNFIKKICSATNSEPLFPSSIEIDGVRHEFNDDTIDIIINEITNKSQQEIAEYLNKIEVDYYQPEIYSDAEYPQFIEATYEDRRRFGLEILLDLKNKISSKVKASKYKIIDAISNSYLSQKIQIKRLENDLRKAEQEEGIEHGRKR